MTMIAAATTLIWLAMMLAGPTPLGRAMRAWLVDRPAAWLSTVDRRKIAVFALVFGGTGLVAWALGHEAARGFAAVLPELAGWSTLIEVTAYLDALVAIVTAASTARIGGLRTWFAARLPKRRPGARRSTRTRTPRTPAANDDDPAPALARAA